MRSTLLETDLARGIAETLLGATRWRPTALALLAGSHRTR